MPYKFLILLLLAELATSCHGDQQFTFIKQLNFDGVSEIDQNGGVAALNSTTTSPKGQLFHASTFQFKNSSTGNTALSFSTSFVFSIITPNKKVVNDGISFTICPTKPLHEFMPINPFMDDQFYNIFSIEFAAKSNRRNRSSNPTRTHLAIKINDLTLTKYSPLEYFLDVEREPKKMNLTSGEKLHVWVDYDGEDKELNVTICPSSVAKPSRPMISMELDLTPLISENMYVGFSTYSGVYISSRYILGWSFKIGGQALEIDRLQVAELSRSKKLEFDVTMWKDNEEDPCFCVFRNFTDLDFDFGVGKDNNEKRDCKGFACPA